MDALQQLQPFDYFVAILFAAIFGWGLQSGAIRQIAVVLGAYLGLIAAASLYKGLGGFLGSVFGREGIQASEWQAYVLIYFAVLVLVVMLSYRFYPNTRVGVAPKVDAAIGGLLGALGALLLAISLSGMLSYYAAIVWNGHELSQNSMREQMQKSLMNHVARTTPVWSISSIWFAERVRPGQQS
jgi:uncharacterized membrane protein required for colicin V production